MTNSLRFAIGILGNVASLLLYGAPIMTFKRIIKNRSTEKFSGFPYAIALLNSLLYTWYGSPLISNGLDNILVLTVNGIGIILGFLFAGIYLKYASSKVAMGRTIVGVMMGFAFISTVSLFGLHDQKHRKMVVGTAGMIVTVVLYASPLFDIGFVVRTKSVEFMPIHFSLFALINSCLWMTYFLLEKDLILACPNILGVPLGIIQVLLYCMYRKQPSPKEKKVDQFDPEIGLKENADADRPDSTAQQSLEMQTQ